jgi:hypothetical protein
MIADAAWSAKVILRHAKVATTQAHYIVLKSAREGRVAMRKLEQRLGRLGSNRRQRKRQKSRKLA